MLWGHYWDASNCMTIPTMVAKPEYRGTASGFAYMFVKLPSFLAIFLFPSLFAAIGQANATLFVAIFPLIGLLSAIFILPEVYGFEHDAGPEPAPATGLQPADQTDFVLKTIRSTPPSAKLPTSATAACPSGDASAISIASTLSNSRVATR